MRIGLQLPWYDWSVNEREIAPTLGTIAREAEAAGFHSLWVMDHFFMLPFNSPPFPKANTVHDPMLECFTTLGYLAGITERVKLGAMVAGVIYRHPGLLVKTATTLDVLSGGRAYFGIGAGWFEEEAVGLGVPYPPTATRFEMLEEALKIAKQMWAEPDGRTPIEGAHFQLREPINRPNAIQHPHPPILIGGGGERKTLRLVAEYADACNLNMGPGPDDYADSLVTMRRKIDVLKRHCDEIGRDDDEIEKTSLGTVHLAPGAMSVDDVLRALGDVADLGIQHAIVNMPNVQEITPLRTFGDEIIPALADL